MKESIEKSGAGLKGSIERTGTGIERTGTGIRAMLFAMACAASCFSSVTVAAPQVNQVGALTVSSTDEAITVSWHKAVESARTIILGSAARKSDFVSIPLFLLLGSTNPEKVLGGGTGDGSSIGDDPVGLEPWGEMELAFNEDGSIEGIITGTSPNQDI